jgi:hypothetical protein
MEPPVVGAGDLQAEAIVVRIGFSCHHPAAAGECIFPHAWRVGPMSAVFGSICQRFLLFPIHQGHRVCQRREKLNPPRGLPRGGFTMRMNVYFQFAR